MELTSAAFPLSLSRFHSSSLVFLIILTLTQVFALIVFDILIGTFSTQNSLIAGCMDDGGSALYANDARPEML